MRRLAMPVALAVGIAGLGLLIACRHSVNFYASGKGNKGGPQTYVRLDDSSGTCTAAAGVGTLGGKSKAKITWHLTNDCTSKQYLAATHYQEYLDPKDPTKLGPVDPDVVDPDQATATLEAGDTDKPLDAKIKKDHKTAQDKLYKYWICVSPEPIPNPLPKVLPAKITCLDPDVDVWP